MTTATFFPRQQEIRDEYQVVAATAFGVTCDVIREGRVEGQMFFPAAFIEEMSYELAQTEGAKQ